MPIKIPNNLPAYQTLTDENIFVMSEERAVAQDIRPLRILLLNLMPTKIVTETQFSRLLGNTPLQVELELMHTASYQARHTSESHLASFYKTFAEVRDNYYDGMVITGAPVELMEFEEVAYWQELTRIMEWSKTHVHSTLHICWGAQAGLYYHFGIQKRRLPEKISGVFEHKVDHVRSILFRGFDDVFLMPHSRNTTVAREDVEARRELKILASSPQAGLACVSTARGKQIFVMGHAEYDPLTLLAEYERDEKAGLHPKIPLNYFPDNDPTKPPCVRWRGHAHLLFANWLNYFVYQSTPYELCSIACEPQPARLPEDGHGTDPELG